MNKLFKELEKRINCLNIAVSDHTIPPFIMEIVSQIKSEFKKIEEQLKNTKQAFEASKFMIKVLNLSDKEEIYKKGIECQKELNRLKLMIDKMPCETHINKDNCDTYCENMKYLTDKYFDTKGVN